MSDRFRLTLAQLNPIVGDIAGNAAKARAAWDSAKSDGADMIALPEMFLSGYQTQDLVQRPAFLSDLRAVLDQLARDCADGPMMGIGLPMAEGGAIHNCWVVLGGGAIRAVIRKHHLPNEQVFDEHRIFTPGDISGPFTAGPLRIGTPICEDAWHEDVAEAQVESGAELLLVPNGSPYARGRYDTRMAHMVARVVENDMPLVYLNLVGGQDDQVFDGASFVLNPGGKLAVQLPAHEEAVVTVGFTRRPEGWQAETGPRATLPDDLAQDYRTMCMGLGDYLRKSGFDRVVLGLSGGIDSALVATIAADTLGPQNVQCVMLPSEYTSPASLSDAADQARRLGCKLDEVNIEGPRRAMSDALAPIFAGLAEDVTEENLQSRLRGTILMAISNKTGAMLLTTGNKSEVAVGYATIYGDMNGGYNPIKDLYKTRVFDICRWRNANHAPWMKAPGGDVVVPGIIDKPPSAELRADQRDDDSLPPYDVLDPILEGLVDHDLSVADLVARGFERDTVQRIAHLIHIAEWKRYQSAPGPRLSLRAFWLDRRYPMVNRWRDRSAHA
ncbi:MAG: NAD+ synthase [Alphaproteobacteria bacterium]|jgi:NAD+ synthase|nr:NAD+ synthase [Alphaproteobacteria bacterium]